MAKKKVADLKPPAEESPTITESEFVEFAKYLMARNTDDLRINQGVVEAFIGSMNGEHVHDIRDLFEMFIKLDRHAGEFWDMKNKRNSH